MSKRFWLAALAFAVPVTTAFAQVPGIIQYQGRVTSNGTLNLRAAGVNESRGLLIGDNPGSLLNLQFVNHSAGVVLSARSPGAKLNLWDGLGLATTRLGAGGGGRVRGSSSGTG